MTVFVRLVFFYSVCFVFDRTQLSRTKSVWFRNLYIGVINKLLWKSVVFVYID